MVVARKTRYRNLPTPIRAERLVTYCCRGGQDNTRDKCLLAAGCCQPVCAFLEGASAELKKDTRPSDSIDPRTPGCSDRRCTKLRVSICGTNAAPKLPRRRRARVNNPDGLRCLTSSRHYGTEPARTRQPLQFSAASSRQMPGERRQRDRARLRTNRGRRGRAERQNRHFANSPRTLCLGHIVLLTNGTCNQPAAEANLAWFARFAPDVALQVEGY